MRRMYIGFSTKKLILVGPKKIFEEGLGQGCTRALIVSFNWNRGCADSYFCEESSRTTYNLAKTTTNIFPSRQRR